MILSSTIKTITMKIRRFVTINNYIYHCKHQNYLTANTIYSTPTSNVSVSKVPSISSVPPRSPGPSTLKLVTMTV